MKKHLLIPALFLAACSKPTKDNVVQAPMEYSISFLPNHYITQYADTTLTVPVIIEYTSGRREPVKLFLNAHPSWARTDTAIFAYPTDTSRYMRSGFPIRFHPFEAGTYAISFGVSTPSSAARYYSFNVTVNPAPDCAAFLIGNYYMTENCAQATGNTNPVSVRANTVANTVLLNSDVVKVNCAGRTLSLAGESKWSWWSATGTFTDDTIYLRYYVHADVPYARNDTCDRVLVRK